MVFVVNFIAPGVGDTLQAILPYEALTILGEVYLQGNLSDSGGVPIMRGLGASIHSRIFSQLK